jgi:cytochrome c-type biogenesis protein CcmE
MRVNKRARQRLIGVTIIVLLIVVGLIFMATQGEGAGASRKTVAEIVADASLIGTQVQVEAPVVKGSWTPGTKPFMFDIQDKSDPNGPVMTVQWDGPIPSAFGDGVTAIVTGEVQEGGKLLARTLITQCPSKYASASDALSVDQLLKSQLAGTTVKITGYIVNGTMQAAGGTERFFVGTNAKGDEKVGVAFGGAFPAGMDDGSKVVITGSLEDNGIFNASDVAIDEADK